MYHVSVDREPPAAARVTARQIGVALFRSKYTWKKINSCMRMPHVPRGPSHACRRATRASAKHHTTHATCEAIGSRGIGRRTGHLSSLAPVTQPLKKEVAPTAIASGETTSFRVATSESEKVEIPIFCFPCDACTFKERTKQTSGLLYLSYYG